MPQVNRWEREKKNPPLFLPPAHLSSPSQSSINEKAGHVWLKAAYNKLCTEHLSRGVRAHMHVLIFSNSFLTSLYLPNLTAVLYSYLLSNHFFFFSPISRLHSSFNHFLFPPFLPSLCACVPSPILFLSWCRWGQLKLIRIPSGSRSNEEENE